MNCVVSIDTEQVIKWTKNQHPTSHKTRPANPYTYVGSTRYATERSGRIGHSLIGHNSYVCEGPFKLTTFNCQVGSSLRLTPYCVSLINPVPVA